MRLIQHTDDLSMFFGTDDFHLFLQKLFGIAAVEAGFQAKLVQQVLIQPLWRELGIRHIEQKVFILWQSVVEFSDQCRLATPGI